MKKTKLVLLTVLLMMVLYCGAVIFVTKPDSFAYGPIFLDIDNIVTVPSSEAEEASAQAERDSISAEIEKVSTEKADNAISVAADQTDAAIKAAVEKYDSQIRDLISSAVADAFAKADTGAAAESVDVSAEIEAAIPTIVDQVTKNIEAGIDSYIPQIVNATIPELLNYEDELAQILYDKYGQTLVDLVSEKVSAELAQTSGAEAAAVAQPVAEMSKDEYDQARQEIRDSEINGLLSQLQD